MERLGKPERDLGCVTNGRVGRELQVGDDICRSDGRHDEERGDIHDTPDVLVVEVDEVEDERSCHLRYGQHHATGHDAM